MTLHRSPADEPFFREWLDRRPGERRSLARARALADGLGLPAGAGPGGGTGLPPILTVVGSKGKGTAAVYAAATLSGAGLRTGLLTSPGVLSNRERVRIDGVALSAASYASLSARLDVALDRLGPREPGGGYLAPTGAFTLAGVRHMLDAGCDALVLEAGMGGASDEVSLFPALVVAVGAIFGEHLGIIGDDVAGVARDKAGVIAPGTRAVLSVAQRPEARAALEAAWEAVRGGAPGSDRVAGSDGARPDIEWVTGCALPDRPAGLSGVNACLGHQAAVRLLEHAGRVRAPHPPTHAADGDARRPPPDGRPPPPGGLPAATTRVLQSVRTPGRLSVHSDARGRTWVLDAAIEATGVGAALEAAEGLAGGPVETILLSFPEEKDVTGLEEVLAGRSFVPVRVPATHIRYPAALLGQPYRDFDSVFDELGARRVLAVGTWSFMAAALDRLGVGLDRVYGEGAAR